MGVVANEDPNRRWVGNASVKLYEMSLNNNLINDVTTTLVVGKATPHG